jgi:hypothetical protein
LTGSNQTQDYASSRRDLSHLARLALALLLAGAPIAGMVGCGGSSEASQQVPEKKGAITALDGSYSDQDVVEKCFPDLDSVALVAAEQGESFTFFAYDGDPLGKRGVSFDFGEMDMPRNRQGTEKEDDYRVEQAPETVEKTHELALERPEVGETPLVGVLTRIARIAGESEAVPEYVVNCGDGIWTDLKPDMSGREIGALAEEIPSGLEGVRIDFIGLGASKPGTGAWVEQLRPSVERLLEHEHAEIGVYDVELPADWPAS